MTRSRWLCLLALVYFCATSAGQQTTSASDPRHVDASGLGTPIDLSKNWLFSPTDSPDHALPGFDDTAWKTVSTQEQLTAYGYRNLEFGWYRVHIQLPPSSRRLAVEVHEVVGRYELFANGTRIGTFGNMNDHSNTHPDTFQAYTLPDGLVASSHGELVLAIRFSLPPLGNNGRGTAVPIFAGAGVTLTSLDNVVRDASFFATHNYGLDWAEALLYALIGLVALALFLALRDQREYLALASTLLLASAAGAVGVFAALHSPTPHDLDTWLTELLSGGSIAAMIEFVRIILGLRRTRLLLLLECIVIVTRLAQPLGFNGFIPNILAFILYFLPLLVVFVLLPILLVGSWHRSRDARLLLPAVLLFATYYYYSFLAWVAYFLHVLHHAPSTQVFHFASYEIELAQSGDFAFIVAILFFIVLRTIRITRDRTRFASEVAAAATVQQLILTRSDKPTPGFCVESVYLPASEVGGDFFLIAPDPDGSLVAILGDVSGKGLPAAMRVAMILGILRRETSRSPPVILANLNSCLLADEELGFTTACCLHLTPTGQYTLANAGHIAPYVAGRELSTPPSLPLGLAPDQSYEPIAGWLNAERLVLMSDGIPEARNANGDLYGFDALCTLTLQSATDIASAASAFGQEDDITVLTIACDG